MTMFNCVEFVCWKPRRRHAKDRRPTRTVLGVTNYDRCRGVYWLVTEIDERIDPRRFFEVREAKPLMILATSKGYHVYWDYSSDKPHKVVIFGLRRLAKHNLADKHHLRLARARGGDCRLKWKLVLRISPKFDGDAITPVYISDELTEWHREVLASMALVHADESWWINRCRDARVNDTLWWVGACRDA